MNQFNKVVTVCLNPAVDRVLEVSDFRIGQHLKGRLLDQYPAGKAINVSRALAKLGRDNIATGFVGRGELDQFERYLEEDRPKRTRCQLLTVRGTTRQNITIIDPKAGTDTHIRDQGFEVGERDIQRVLSKVGLLAGPNTVVVFSGSLPLGMGPGQFGQLVAVAGEAGSRVVLDVEGPLLRQVMSPAEGGGEAVWLIKPNRAEFADMINQPGPMDRDQVVSCARRLAERVAWVSVSFGRDGACLVGRDGVWFGWVPVETQTPVSTVGCGDCLLAGLIDAHLSGYEPGEVLRRAMAVAVANTADRGPACFTPDQMVVLYDRIQVERWD